MFKKCIMVGIVIIILAAMTGCSASMTDEEKFYDEKSRVTDLDSEQRDVLKAKTIELLSKNGIEVLDAFVSISSETIELKTLTTSKSANEYEVSFINSAYWPISRTFTEPYDEECIKNGEILVNFLSTANYKLEKNKIIVDLYSNINQKYDEETADTIVVNSELLNMFKEKIIKECTNTEKIGVKVNIEKISVKVNIENAEYSIEVITLEKLGDIEKIVKHYNIYSNNKENLSIVAKALFDGKNSAEAINLMKNATIIEEVYGSLYISFS